MTQFETEENVPKKSLFSMLFNTSDNRNRKPLKERLSSLPMFVKLFLWIPMILAAMKVAQLFYSVFFAVLGGEPSKYGGSFIEVMSGLLSIVLFIFLIIMFAYYFYEGFRDTFD